MGQRGVCYDLCQRVFCLCLPLSVIVSDLTFKLLSILSLFLCVVLESILVSFFYMTQQSHCWAYPEVKWSESCSVMSDSLQHIWLYCPWDSPGQNTRMGSLSLLQGIFLTQGLSPGLPHCRWILYQLSHKGSPMYPEKNHNSKRHMHPNVHRSSIYNSQDTEAT